jgi:hypothetical protein
VGCTYRPRLLPGTTGWQARGHQTPVRRRISPVPCSAVRTFRSPYAGRFFQAASPRSSPVPWPSPCRKGLGSASFLRERRTCYDAAGFASSYGPHARSTPNGAFVVTLRRFGSLLAPATSYTAAWSLPWPDLHRLVEHSFQDALRPQVCGIQRSYGGTFVKRPAFIGPPEYGGFVGLGSRGEASGASSTSVSLICGGWHPRSLVSSPADACLRTGVAW